MDVAKCERQKQYHMPRGSAQAAQAPRLAPDGGPINDVVVYQQPNDDCQHRCHLTSTFRNCQAQLEMIMVSHDSYISLIEELKSDLDSLSYEMKNVHDELGRHSIMDHDPCGAIGCPDLKDKFSSDLDYEPMKRFVRHPITKHRSNRHRPLAIQTEQNDRGKTFDNADVVSVKSEDMLICACQYANSAIPMPGNLQSIENPSNQMNCLDYIPSDMSLSERLDNALHESGQRKRYLQPSENDNSLKAQIHQMSTTICDREKQINHMSAMLQQLESKHKTEILGLKENSERELGELRQKLKESNLKAECLMRDLSCLQKNEGFLKGESRKLNDELVEVKQRNQILLAQQNQLKTLLQTQEQHRMDLVKKYETLDENYECQSKKLQTMQTQFVHLQEHLAEMGRSHDSHVHDYQRIQGELMAFKEREATLLGKYTALQEQFRKANTEIDQAHNVIKQQQSIMEHNETLHRNSVKTLQQATESMRAEFHSICEEYKKLKVQYSQQLDVDKHNERVLDSFRKWKEAQTKADAATRLTFKQYEGNIRALLEEKQEFLDEYRKLQRDFHLVQNELTRIRRAAASKRGSGMTLEPDTAIIQRIDLLRNITSRISNHAATVYGDSSSSGDAGKKQNNFDSPNNSSSY